MQCPLFQLASKLSRIPLAISPGTATRTPPYPCACLLVLLRTRPSVLFSSSHSAVPCSSSSSGYFCPQPTSAGVSIKQAPGGLAGLFIPETALIALCHPLPHLQRSLSAYRRPAIGLLLLVNGGKPFFFDMDDGRHQVRSIHGMGQEE